MPGLTLIFGNKNYSSWSLRPWIFMRHFQIPFEEKRIPLFTDTTDEQLAPYFSNYKVPVLLDGEFVVWDSLAILEYLSENYLQAKGWPEDVKARAVARSVSAEMHSSFTNLRNVLPMNCRKKFPGFKLSPEVQTDIDRVKAVWRHCREQYGREGDWLFGEFSIADAMYAPVALRFAGYDVQLENLEAAYVQTILNHPDIIDWIDAGTKETEIIGEDEI
jgi:glutathione S-transferase